MTGEEEGQIPKASGIPESGLSLTMYLPAMTLYSCTVNWDPRVGRWAPPLLVGSFPSRLVSRHLPILFEIVLFPRLLFLFAPLLQTSLSLGPGCPIGQR